ncbi:MAG: hypothetical protein ACFFCZ_08695 [Promethearchaeota archaeon]
MKVKIKDLDENRLRAIYKHAQYQKNISPSEQFAIAMNHIEGLRRLRQKAKRIEDHEKIR